MVCVTFPLNTKYVMWNTKPKSKEPCKTSYGIVRAPGARSSVLDYIFFLYLCTAYNKYVMPLTSTQPRSG